MSDEESRNLYEKLARDAKAGGYLLNPDQEFVLELMDGLVINQKRYGYLACPCRLADGVRAQDLDIICPCDYRDPDLSEFGTCYCALYVSDEIAQGQKQLEPVPERRGQEPIAGEKKTAFKGGDLPVYRCKVCGYLCARPEPPLKCPICKADQDRFERFA